MNYYKSQNKMLFSKKNNLKKGVNISVILSGNFEQKPYLCRKE